jgi:two-component system response regulator ResD
MLARHCGKLVLGIGAFLRWRRPWRSSVARVILFWVFRYICKPFSPRELVARVKAVLRRSGLPAIAVRPTLTFGRLEIDERAREARVDGTDVKLKPREFALLIELASNPGIALSRERLVQKVWGFDFNGDERTVDVHVHRLRLKIETAWKLPPVLQTVHGFGYKFQRP